MGEANDPERGTEGVLVVAVDLPRDGVGASPTDPATHPDAAVALWVSETEDPATGATAGTPEAGTSSTGPIFELAQRHRAPRSDVWVGDWDEWKAPRITGSVSPTPRPVLPAHGPLSQGAYVPRPRYWENLPSRWRFLAEKCGFCNAITFPLRGRCRQCGKSDHTVIVRLPLEGGVVVATTKIGPGGQPAEFDEQVAATGSYQVVLVDLAPGVRVTLQVSDQSILAIGDRVGTRIRRLYGMEGEWRYGRKAVSQGPPDATRA
jgi:uncharacterized OB-fold protein